MSFSALNALRKRHCGEGKMKNHNLYFGWWRHQPIEKDGKTMVVSMGRTEIGMAKTLIHEAIHAKIGLTNKDDDANHNTFSTYQSTMLSALKEYNTDNKLGFSDSQIEALSWEGAQKSDAFKTYINGIAEKNGTTYDQEYKNWYNTIEQMGWKETKKEEKK
jgi:hypothetical protein